MKLNEEIHGTKIMSTNKLSGKPNSTSKEAICAALNSLHHINIIKDNLRNSNTDTYFIGIMPDIIKIVAENCFRHVSKHNLELLSWKCTVYKMNRNIQN